MTFVSQSQAGQDRWAWEMCGRKTSGSFLDIGSFHHVVINNTYALEQMGWRGLGIDLNESSIAQSQGRKSRFIVADATKIDWNEALIHAAIPEIYGTAIDYVSLDVDEATPAALQNLLAHGIKFNVATVETDRYRFGDGPRNEMREILMGRSYDLVCADVVVDGFGEFEDWYCCPIGVSSVTRDKFRCQSKRGKDIVSKVALP